MAKTPKKYYALLAYNVSHYANVYFEAEDDDAALERAKELALTHDGDYNFVGEATKHRVVELVGSDGEEIWRVVMAKRFGG